MAGWQASAPAITTREFISKIYAAAGNDPQIQAMSRVMVNVVGLFNGQVRELKEMLYEFEEPFIVESTDFEATFGQHASDLDDAIAAAAELGDSRRHCRRGRREDPGG